MINRKSLKKFLKGKTLHTEEQIREFPQTSPQRICKQRTMEQYVQFSKEKKMHPKILHPVEIFINYYR